MADPMPRIFIIVSAAVHAVLGMWVEVRETPTPAPSIVADPWTGDGIEVDAWTPANAPSEQAHVSETSAASPSDATRNEPDGARVSTEPDVTTTTPPPPVAPVPAERPVTSAARAVAATSRARSARPRTAAAAPRAPDATKSSTTTDGASPNAAGSTEDNPANGNFGAAGLPAGVRHLPKAFTRALGLASRGDPRWLALPVGPVGEARIRLSVDEEGRLGELEYDERTPAGALAPVLEHLLANTRLLLLAGRFSLDATRERAGAQDLRVRVEINDAEPSEATGDPNGLNELEYEAPLGKKPGRGSFRLNSGRRVIGWVYVE